MHESFPDAECQDAGDKTGDTRMVTSHVRQHLPFRGQACKSVGHYGEEHAAFQTGSPCIVLDKNEKNFSRRLPVRLSWEELFYFLR